LNPAHRWLCDQTKSAAPSIPDAGRPGIQLLAPQTVKQTVVEGVLHEAGESTVEELTNRENEVLLSLLALRAKAGL